MIEFSSCCKNTSAKVPEIGEPVATPLSGWYIQPRKQLITPHKDTMALTSYSFVPLLLHRRTPYVAVHTLVLMMMGILMPKTC